MKRPMLEVTFRCGRPLAAYVRVEGVRAKAATTRQLASGLVGDFDANGALLGLEILAFDSATLSKINAVLTEHGGPALDEQELAPLRAA